jgi:small conductance mechanosensitive channel
MLESINLQEIANTYLYPWGRNIGVSVLIFIVGFYVTKILIRILRKVLQNAGMENILVNFISSIVNWLLLLFVIIAALSQLGVNTNSLIALIGAAGLAIGLALQDSLKNFASGVMLITFRPFKEGDFVEAGGTTGTVEKITIFSSTLRTPDNKEVIVPNGPIYSEVIVNYSARENRRVDMVFGIGYGDDIKKAKELIEKIIGEDPRILKHPEPLVAVGELADSSVNFAVRPWVKTGDYWDVKFDITEKIKLAFDENGISIPFPQMDVHVDRNK